MHNPDAIQKRLNEEGPKHWLHKFEVIKGSGIFTPGNLPVGNFPDRAKKFGVEPGEFKGKRCLDIGTWTGGNAFAMEDLGADVVAIDIQNPFNTGFSLVHDIRKSTIEYIQASVYDLNPEQFGYFDIIWFSGVHYHLKHPILALERINSVCNNGSLLLMQGRGCDYWCCDTDPKKGVNFDKLKPNKKIPKSVMTVDSINDLPISSFIKEKYFHDTSCWFLPNLKCAEAWLVRTGFKIVKSFSVEAPFKDFREEQGVTGTAIFINATRVSEPEVEYEDASFLRRVHKDFGKPLLHHYKIGINYKKSENVVIKGHKK